MEQTAVQQVQDGEVFVFDEFGRLIGIIPHPQSGEPIGTGRETVYLAKATRRHHPAAA